MYTELENFKPTIFNFNILMKILFVIEPKRGAKTLPGSRENVWGVINSPSHN
jgi:hypothetical protein